MSAMTKAIIRAYRARLSTRPDGETHVMDARGITHVVRGETWQITDWGSQASDGDEEYAPVLSNRGYAVPTWNDVDCMACLTRTQTEDDFDRYSYSASVYDAQLAKARSGP